ncbi:uncharacterized protein LOC110096767 [Dendrobium catenatum]|uniref:uncharacterized protein LOC110096767 n=1 Tax=Dendrobium catenatum TaxID=906689 RepID=UPI0009F21A06|nr:uncharacterized protein LOC110096767 [Dendrobium catenatum]
MHVISWKTVTTPKCMGGLGIPSFEALYHAVACSFILRMYNVNSLTSHWCFEMYESPWKPPSPSASKFWKLICAKAQLIKEEAAISISPASKFSVLWDPWLFEDSLCNTFYCNDMAGLRVKDIILDGMWHLPLSWPSDITAKICNIGIMDSTVCLGWKGDSHPVFKTFINHFYKDLDNVDWSKYVWHRRHAIRFACYSWMALMGKLKTTDLLIHRGISANPSCSFCLGNNESHNHLFFSCDYTFLVLSLMLPDVGFFYLRPNLFQVYEFFWRKPNFSAKEKQFCSLVISATVYFIWRERNQRKFSHTCSNPVAVKEIICNAIKKKFFFLEG